MDAVADHFLRCIAVRRIAVAVNHLEEENPSDAVPRTNVGDLVVIITRLLWNRRG